MKFKVAKNGEEWKKDNPQDPADDKTNPKNQGSKSHFVEGITREQLWETINENTLLKQENYMLKNKLAQIKRLLPDE